MTITSTVTTYETTGNGVATSYIFNYPIHKTRDLIVYAAGSVRTSGDSTYGHTITIAANKQSGTIVFTTAPADTIPLKFERKLEYKQETDLANNSLFDAESLETSLDNIVMQVQQIGNVVLSSTESIAFTFNGALGTGSAMYDDTPTIASTLSKNIVERANKALAFDDVGDITVSTDDIDAQIAATAGSATAASSSAGDAASSASAAAANLATFQSLFHGASGTAPTGGTVSDGDLWFDTSSGVNLMKVYNLSGTAWEQLTPTSTHQTNINTVVASPLATNIGLVAAIDDKVTTVAAIDDKITTVANITTGDVTKVADIATGDVTKVADITAGDVTEVADINTEITTLINGTDGLVGTSGTTKNILLVNTVAGSIADVNHFALRYRIASSEPGSANDAGDLYFNTTTNTLYAYGVAWQATAPNAADQTAINIVAGELTYEEDLGLITEAVTTTSGNNITDVAAIDTEIDLLAALTAEITRLGTSAMATATTGHIARLGNAAVVEDLGLLGLAGVIEDMDFLGTSVNVANMATLTATGVVANIATVATDIGDVNRYANEYKIASSEPSSPSEGDLWYDSTLNVIKFHNGTSFVGMHAEIHNEMAQDTTPTLGGDLDAAGNDITNMGNIDGTNLNIDFGSIA